MKRLTVVAVCLALGGCATSYSKADGSASNPRDLQECQYDASRATAGATNPNPLQGPMGGVHALMNNSNMREISLEFQCMKLKGYKSP